MISIVVPVYNIADYLDECVTSVINQSYADWECILVDDGSADSSSEKCDNYAETHDNIFVVHKKNGGLAAARNTGLDLAKGEYIYFLDGDDKLTKDALKHFAEKANNDCDIVLGQMSYFFDNSVDEAAPFGDIVKEDWVKDRSGKEAFVEIHNHIKVLMMGVRGLYRRNFLLCNNLRFDEYCRYSEDQEWTPRCFEMAKKISSNENRDYLYRMGRQGSLMNSINPRKIELTLEIYDRWYRKIISNPVDPFYICLNEVLIRRFWECYFKYPPLLHSDDYNTFYSMMDSRRLYITENPLVKKNDRHVVLIKYFPAKYICKLTKLWLRIKS